MNSNYRQCNSNYRKILNIKIAGQLLAIAVQNDTCWGLRVTGGDFVQCADSIDLTFNNLTLVGFVDG